MLDLFLTNPDAAATRMKDRGRDAFEHVWKRPLTLVQQKLGLRLLSHHKVGRHSVASQAVTGGESVKAVQAQLGHRSEQSTHKYSHLGSGAGDDSSKRSNRRSRRASQLARGS